MLGRTHEARCRRVLREMQPGPGDIALDCGANVGDMAVVLARRGATVHAFEPNPHAFAVLRQRFAGNPNVHCHQAAVGVKAGRQALYLHENSLQDEVYWSNGSSLLAEKPNVSSERSVDVQVVDLVAFLRDLGRPVKVLKMDIEGAEVEVLNHMIDSDALKLAQNILVEMHDSKIPGLAGPAASLRQHLHAIGASHVRLDWV